MDGKVEQDYPGVVCGTISISHERVVESGYVVVPQKQNIWVTNELKLLCKFHNNN